MGFSRAVCVIFPVRVCGSLSLDILFIFFLYLFDLFVLFFILCFLFGPTPALAHPPTLFTCDAWRLAFFGIWSRIAH